MRGVARAPSALTAARAQRALQTPLAAAAFLDSSIVHLDHHRSSAPTAASSADHASTSRKASCAAAAGDCVTRFPVRSAGRCARASQRPAAGRVRALLDRRAADDRMRLVRRAPPARRARRSGAGDLPSVCPSPPGAGPLRPRLAGVSQSQLDAWIAELPSHRPALRAFVRWAVGHDYMRAGLDILAASIRELRSAMDDDERLGLARHLLRDRTDDPPARLAAVLVLLFGQRVTRITVLEVGAVSVDDDGVSRWPCRIRRYGYASPWPDWRRRSRTRRVAAVHRGCSPAAKGTGPCPPSGCVTGSVESA